MTAVDRMELRIRAGSILLEALLALIVVVSITVGFSSYRQSPGEERTARRTAPWVYVAALLFMSRRRWRQRIVIGPAGVRWRRSENDEGRGLTWSEVEEFFILGPEEFELRGAGRSILFTPSFGGLPEARAQVSRALGDLRHRLRDRALREGELHFRMPALRWKAHALYLVALLVLTGLSAAGVVHFLRRDAADAPLLVLVVAFGVWLVWKLRRLASGMGTIVTLYRDGILVRRLDGSRKIGWSTVTAAEWNEKGELEIVLEGGKRVPLPRQLGNLTLLEGFIDEARTGPTSS